MAKVLIVGSQKAHNPVEFKNACRSVGAALAHRGHTMVAAGCGDYDAETWVLDGANSALRPDRKLSVIPFEPALPGTQDLIVRDPSGVAARWPNLLFLPPFKTKGPWAVGQAVALVRSDVALLIGGGDLTANVGSLALELGKPYYAVSGLGGAAKAIADGDLAKHRALGMPEVSISPAPSAPEFGDNVVRAIEFVMSHTQDKAALRRSVWILSASLAILAVLVAFLVRHDPFGTEPKLIYTTCLGAIAGVMLSLLIASAVRKETVNLSAVLEQLSLACFLGFLYGYFALEAGSLYKVNFSTWSVADVDSFTMKVAVLGIAVGALLGPASKRVLEKLSEVAKLDTKRP